MILTVTLNPSVDMNYKLDNFILDGVNRVSDVSKTAGGKGLNVTRVLRQLDVDVSATGFVGGHLGEFIEEKVDEIKAQSQFVTIDGETRNCIAIIHDGKQTEVLEAGPTISESDKNKFVQAFREMMSDKEVVAMSGSLPKGLAKDFYNELLKIAYEQDVPVILDTSGESLEKAVKEGQPFLIKPNETELAALIGEEMETSEQIIATLKSDLFAHIPWVFVTRGAEGAIVKVDSDIYEAKIPEVKVVNPVGSGDATVAGICAAISREMNTEEIIAYALTMGTLNAMEEETGSVDVEKIGLIKQKIKIKRIN